MKMQVIMMNEVKLVMDEKTNELVGVVAFQASVPSGQVKELITKIENKKDGTFDITLE